MILTVDLEPKDFEKIIVLPKGGGVFFVSTGPDFLFMTKVAVEVNKIERPKLDGYKIKFRFENADGSPWGDLGTDYGPDWAEADPKAFFKKGKWGTAFLLKRLWIKQQVRVAEAMDLPVGGLFFRQDGALRDRYGDPARFTAEFEVRPSILESLCSLGKHFRRELR